MVAVIDMKKINGEVRKRRSKNYVWPHSIEDA